MRKKWKKAVATVLVGTTTLALTACGGGNGKAAATSGTASGSGDDSAIAADSPYAGKGYNLSQKEDVILYVVGDEPADMQKVIDKANQDYFEPNLNTTLEIKFLNWSDYATKYSLLLSGGEQVDMIYTAAWCYYNEEAAKGAFMELTDDFLKEYMPYTYEEQPQDSWDQISIDGKIYAVPKAKATFTGYNIVAVRQDLIDQYNLTTPDSWDNYKTYLKELAGLKSETGVVPLNTNANREQLMNAFLQTKSIQSVAEGYDWLYYNNGKEDAPSSDDIFYYYGSDLNLEYCKEMAELAKDGAWSTDAINDTTDPQSYFENGTSGSFVWNTSVFPAGKNLEDAGNGTYAVYDLSPETPRSRTSYSTDAIAITTSSKDPERTALVLDYMKSDVGLNRLLMGGMEGTYWELDEDGNRVTLDAAENYAWNNWAWALNRQDEPDEAGMDERQIEIQEKIDAKEYHPAIAGFTFDPKNVETEYTMVKSVVDEYKQSFALGIYGDDTENEFDTFKQKLEGAGLEKVTEELITQYNAYVEKKGL